jgi:hypothetical protein
MNSEDRLRYSADLPMIGAARPPGEAAVEGVRDVLLIAGDSGIDQGDPDELVLLPRWDREAGRQSQPDPIYLGPDLALDKLERDEAERVLNACSPRGHYFAPIKQYGQMYSLVLGVDLAELEGRRFSWDTGGEIRDALAMSRLILDNGYSLEYAARIFDYANDQQQIMPALLIDQPHTYRVRRMSRDWLRNDEAARLGELLSQYGTIREDLPERVAHALWLAEYIVSVRWLDVIAPLLVVAFEALVNTSNQLVTRQFQERVPALTEEAGAPMSPSLCERMYDTRSRWVHGRRVSLYRRPTQPDEPWEGPTDDEQRAAVERVANTQDALRTVVRRCIEDAEFRAIFEEDERIRDRWPVGV